MIIILLTVILLIVLILIVKNKETFNNFLTPKISFLSVNQACDVLKNVKELQDYNDLDFKIRKINKNIYEDKVADYYCDKLLDFSKYDKILINWMYDNIYKYTPKHLKFLYKNIKFAKYTSKVENGFPHTHKDVIFLTENFINNLIPYYNRNNAEIMIKNIGVIIIHECVHIWQRKDDELFYKLYIYYWNFIKVHKIHNNHMSSKIRFNPDGPDTNWVFNFKNQYIIPLSIYNDNAKNIGNVSNVGVFLNKNGISFTMPHKDDIVVKKLEEIDGFNKLFKNVHGNNYHPHELSAELISIYYMKKMNISHSNFNNNALDKLETWFKNDVFSKYVYLN